MLDLRSLTATSGLKRSVQGLAGELGHGGLLLPLARR